MITYEISIQLGGKIVWIQSVYVDADHRGKGVFRSLFNYVVAQAKNEEIVKSVRLYVDVDNKEAQQVYQKLGMSQLKDYFMEELDLHFPGGAGDGDVGGSH